MSTSPDNQPSQSEPGPEQWVPEAIAQQEEYLKRMAPCGGVRFREHTFRQFGVPDRDHRIAREHFYDACIACGVTRTDEDYQRRLAGRRANEAANDTCGDAADMLDE
jgi:hypothetical protein